MLQRIIRISVHTDELGHIAITDRKVPIPDVIIAGADAGACKADASRRSCLVLKIKLVETFITRPGGK
jgi:hypothetical protein